MKKSITKKSGLKCRDFGCVVCRECGRSFFGQDKEFNNHKCNDKKK